jgi:hypothetical protein
MSPASCVYNDRKFVHLKPRLGKQYKYNSTNSNIIVVITLDSRDIMPCVAISTVDKSTRIISDLQKSRRRM